MRISSRIMSGRESSCRRSESSTSRAWNSARTTSSSHRILNQVIFYRIFKRNEKFISTLMNFSFWQRKFLEKTRGPLCVFLRDRPISGDMSPRYACLQVRLGWPSWSQRSHLTPTPKRSRRCVKMCAFHGLNSKNSTGGSESFICGIAWWAPTRT